MELREREGEPNLISASLASHSIIRLPFTLLKVAHRCSVPQPLFSRRRLEPVPPSSPDVRQRQWRPATS